MAANSTKAIFFALGANAGIAVTKFGAAAYTGSGAMLAEAIHSVADTANQLLLLLGLKQARAPVSAHHPLGQSRVVYFWSMMVALLLFFVGGLFSIYEGWHRLHGPNRATRRSAGRPPRRFDAVCESRAPPRCRGRRRTDRPTHRTAATKCPRPRPPPGRRG